MNEPAKTWREPAVEFLVNERGFEPDIVERCTTIFLMDLAGRWYSRRHFFPIWDTIRKLEQRGRYLRSLTKNPTVFQRPVLKGLHHKHYWTAAHIEKNIELYWKSKEGKRWAKEHGFSALPSDQQLWEYVMGAFRRRTADPRTDDEREGSDITDPRASGSMTGEWIIYVKDDEGANRYLTLAEHAEGDGNIKRRLLQCCVPEFPRLTPPRAAGDEWKWS